MTDYVIPPPATTSLPVSTGDQRFRQGCRLLRAELGQAELVTRIHNRTAIPQ